jgi:hypothetical protein
VLQCQANEATDALRVTANFDVQPVAPTAQLELHMSRPLLESEGRLGVILGDMDITALCNTSANSVRYLPTPVPLPVGETSVIVYLVSGDNEWTEIARLRLIVEEPKANEGSDKGQTPNSIQDTKKGPSPFQFIPSVSVNVKGQSTALYFPDSNRPQRMNFTDIAVQTSFQGNYKRGDVAIQNQFDFAGSSVQNEALRFGQMGNNAPQFDLSAYTMLYQFEKVQLKVGNVSFGTNRELINSFTSRGISVTVPITKRFDVSGAIMNGTSIVGFDNFLGISRTKHQFVSATLGMEVL